MWKLKGAFTEKPSGEFALGWINFAIDMDGNVFEYHFKRKGGATDGVG
jgi:hypothetical protein